MHIFFRKSIACLTVFSLFWSNVAFCMEDLPSPHVRARPPSPALVASGSHDDPPLPPPSDRSSSRGDAVDSNALELIVLPPVASPSSPAAATANGRGGHTPSSTDSKQGDDRDSPLRERESPSSVSLDSSERDDTLLGSFLRARGWTREILGSHGIDVQVLEDLANVEMKLCPPRLDSLDLIIEKAVYPLLGREGIYHTDEEMSRCSTCCCCSCSTFCMQGRAIPTKSRCLRRLALLIHQLREGIQDGAVNAVQLTFAALLLYQLVNSSPAKLFDTFNNADRTSFLGIVRFLRQNQAFFSIPVIPVLLGPARALWRALNIDPSTPETVQYHKGIVEGHGHGFWQDYVLPWIPLTPLRGHSQNLERSVLWDGELPIAAREEAFQAFLNLAKTRTGYSQMLVMNALARIAHGLHLQDHRLLSKTHNQESLLHYLSMKTRALKELRSLREEFHNATFAWSCAGIMSYLFNIRRMVEINSLLWSLGQSPSYKTSAVVFTLRAARWTSIGLFFAVLARTLQEYLNCPLLPDFSWENTGDTSVKRTLSRNCLKEAVNQFGTIPGQPVETLTDIIPQVDFGGDKTFELDLSNKGLTGGNVVKIVQAFIDNGITITKSNLEGNFVNRASDFEELFPLLRSVRWLNLANNGIESEVTGSYVEDTQGLAESIGNLTSATHLDLSRNRIGLNHYEGMVVLGQRLASPILTSFNFSRNFMGRAGSDGAIAFGNFALRQLPALTELDLSDNWLENGIDTLGTQAIANGTRTLPLRFLSLRNNMIATSIYDPFGLGALGDGFPPTLTDLDVSGNFFANVDFSFFDLFTQGLRRLSSLRRFRIHPQIPGLNATHVAHLNDALDHTQVTERPFTPLNTPEEVDTYFDAFPLTTSDFNLRARIGTPEILPRVMERLAGFPVRSLDVSENWFEYINYKGAVPFGLGLRNLTLLEELRFQYNFLGNWDPQGGIAIFDNMPSTVTFIDGSHNVFGGSSVEDTRALGRNLRRFPRLTTLRLADNAIEATGIQGTVEFGHGVNASSALTCLDVSYNYMGGWGPDGLEAIFQGLKGNPITSLSLSNNLLGYTDTNETVALAAALPDYRLLQSLDLSINSLGLKGTEGLDTLVRALPTLPNLQNIRLAGARNISWTEGAQALASLKGDALRQACEAERCFGTPLTLPSPSQDIDQEQGQSLNASPQTSAKADSQSSQQQSRRTARIKHRLKPRSVKKDKSNDNSNKASSTNAATNVPLLDATLSASAAPASPTRIDMPDPSNQMTRKPTVKGAPQLQNTAQRPVTPTSPSHEDVAQYLARAQLQQKGKWDSIKSWFSFSGWVDWASRAAFNLATEQLPDGTRVNAMPATFPNLLNPQVNDWALPTSESEQPANLLSIPAMAQLPLPSAGAAPAAIGAP